MTKSPSPIIIGGGGNRTISIIIFLLILIILVFIFSPSVSAYPSVTSNLKNAWDMSSKSSGAYLDFGPDNERLQITGTTQTSGNYCGPGSAVQFTTGSDYLSNSTSPLVGGTHFTIASYLKADALSTSSYVLRFGSGSQAMLFGFTASEYQIYTGSFHGSIVVPDSNYHWIVWTSDGVNLKGYLDGTLVDTSSAVGLGTAGTFYVGVSSPSTDPWKGAIDELYIYSDALNSTEVSGIAPSCPTPDDFTLSASNNTLLFRMNDVGYETVSVSGLFGFNGNVSLSYSSSMFGGVGLTLICNPAKIEVNSTTAFCVVTAQFSGHYNLTITGTNSTISKTHSLFIPVIVLSVGISPTFDSISLTLILLLFAFIVMFIVGFFERFVMVGAGLVSAFIAVLSWTWTGEPFVPAVFSFMLAICIGLAITQKK